MPELPVSQAALFEEDGAAAEAGARTLVAPADPGEAVRALAAALKRRHGDSLHLGTSSWHFPGWAGLVWQRPAPEQVLSRHGLAAYACHPLLRCVSLDRAFYRPLDVAAYQALAAQVGTEFRFVVKAAAMISDAVQRDPANGAALQPNPQFLEPAAALALCVQPAVQGLGERLGVLVFQLSPLPAIWLRDPTALHRRLARLFDAVVPALPAGTLAALEVRDAVLLTPELAALLKRHRVRYCLGLHDRLPGVDGQLPMLRATWPGELVCRWNLQRGQRYAQARDRWAPFDRLQAPDLPTRAALARVVAGTLGAGHRAFVTINNKAEGSAPHSVTALAEAVLSLP
jgi:uncharacterized protein YecE (DUF72 family)